MFKVLIEYALVIILILVLVTQVIIPMFIPSLDMFWLFRKSKPVPPDTPIQRDLDDSIADITSELEEHADKYKNTLNRVDSAVEVLKKTKGETINYINNKNK